MTDIKQWDTGFRKSCFLIPHMPGTRRLQISTSWNVITKMSQQEGMWKAKSWRYEQHSNKWVFFLWFQFRGSDTLNKAFFKVTWVIVQTLCVALPVQYLVAPSLMVLLRLTVVKWSPQVSAPSAGQRFFDTGSTGSSWTSLASRCPAENRWWDWPESCTLLSPSSTSHRCWHGCLYPTAHPVRE